MYKAEIKDIREEIDSIVFFVEFSDGEKVEMKKYNYVMLADIDCATHGIDNKILEDLEKLNNPEVPNGEL
ncbi:MAG: hypothetical protein ABFC34_13770 [Methanobacterium sp.]